MAINFQQTDTANDCARAAFCSGRSDSAGTLSAEMQASDGGTAGTVEESVTLAASEANAVLITCECVVAAGVTWKAGTWTVRIDITTGQADFDITEVHLCRVNSSCVSQASFGSLTGLTEQMSAGVHTFSVTGSAQTPSVGDMVQICFVATNANICEKQVKYTPTQLVDSPFATGGFTPRSYPRGANRGVSRGVA